MILKYGQTDDVYFVEATGNRGVSFNKWENIREHIGPDQFYAKLSWRQCRTEKDLTTKLAKFLGKTQGRKYGIGADKLVQQKTLRLDKQDDEDEMNIEEGRTFFCSELVAKAYKVLGIIEDDDTSCTQFYPVHFSQEGDHFLKVTKDTEIGPEMQIIID